MSVTRFSNVKTLAMRLAILGAVSTTLTACGGGIYRAWAARVHPLAPVLAQARVHPRPPVPPLQAAAQALAAAYLMRFGSKRALLASVTLKALWTLFTQALPAQVMPILKTP